MQGAQVWFLIGELKSPIQQLSPHTSTTEPVSSRACGPQPEKPECRNEDPVQPKKKKSIEG